MQKHRFIIDNGIEKREVASTTLKGVAEQIREALFEEYKYAQNMKIYYKHGANCTDILKQKAKAVS